MANSWTGDGPVTLPPKPLAYGVAATLCLLALVGVGLGLRASHRDNGGLDLGGPAAESADSADTLIAKPIVELPQPVASNTADNAVADEDKSDDKVQSIEEKTAEAQQVQATTSKAQPNIDQILASPTEKPPTLLKAPAAEKPPGPPVKSDVPF